MTKDNAGIVINVGLAQDDQGRTVMRAIVDFYDGAAPDINFKTVWNRTPVTIVEVEQS